MSDFHHRDDCRLCGSSSVELVFPLAATPLADEFVPGERLEHEQPAYPLDLFLCRSCGHVQMLDVVDPELLFGNYIYKSSSSPDLADHFAAYAREVGPRLGVETDDLAVDIGSNDGLLLGNFKEQGMRVLGVDPARAVAADATARGIPTLPELFTSGLAEQLRSEHGPAALVTANNVFAHADDLADIARGVRILLADDGVFVFEVAYLLDLLDNLVFDSAYHEHLSHHSVKPLVPFLVGSGLELFDVERIPTKGGSIRCFAQPAGGPRERTGAVEALIATEDGARLDEPGTWYAFRDRISALREETRRQLAEAKGRGWKIGGFGASATTTTLTYHFGLDEFLDCILDDRPERQGLYSPGHHIPVVSSELLHTDDRPDLVIVLAWRFAEPITTKHAAFVQRGGRFLVPVPEVRVLEAARAADGR